MTLKRKRVKHRPAGVYCQRHGTHRCPRRQVVRLNGVNLCAKHGADQLFSEAVRARGRCEVAPMFPDVECAGQLQCSHVISRRYGATRWDEANALSSCAAHHMYTTHHPLEWEEANAADWERLRREALHGTTQDPFEIIERYRP